MTADEYRAAIAKLDLSQVKAAARLGVNEKTSRDWARAGPPPSVAVSLAALLTLKDIGVDPFKVPAIVAAAERPIKKPPSE